MVLQGKFLLQTNGKIIILHYLIASSNIADKEDGCNSFKNMCFNQGMHVSAAEVIELIREISNGKAARMDGLSGESLKYMQTIISQFYYLFVLPVCLNTVIFLSASF